MTDDRIVVRLRIAGRVQGVSYRYWFEGEARRLGVTGTVRNRLDGTVEAVCIASPAVLDGLQAACRIGPPGARVDTIDVQTLDGAEKIAALAATGFRRLPTA